MIFDRKNLSDDELKQLYKALLYPRLVEEKMLILLRQGRIGKWFSGIGQEAIAVGATLAMLPDEYILPMHRNLGVFTSRQIPLRKLMAQWQGKATGFTNGRDRSFHFGTRQHKIVGMISHLGPQLGVADGIALASKLSGRNQATLVFTGEGATSEGDFHEALNVAAVWSLPVIFLIENNGYGLSTPVSEQFKCEKLSDRALGYGMEGRRIDGNNVLEVFHTIAELAADIRENPRPVLIECMTFRMRGHEEASGTKYVPPQLFDEWSARDPVTSFESWLVAQELLGSHEFYHLQQEMKQEIDRDIESAFHDPEVRADEKQELSDVFAPFSPMPFSPPKTEQETTPLRYIDAISSGMDMAMQRWPKLVLMGQDIAEYGGAFKITNGFAEKYGKERVRNTPLCESAIVGASLGLSVCGYKSMVEMQFADFVSCGFNQIVNNLAKTHYRWGQPADVVIRMPTGAGTGAGPFHSQSNEAWFTHVAGLKVVYPAFPEDAKGLLLAAFADPNPVLYFEHKFLYRSISGPVSPEFFTTEIGKARVVQKGKKMSLITYGLGVHWALEYCARHPELSIEILDLRSLQPWDRDAVAETVMKTSRALILHEDTLTGGFGGEIASWIGEHCFTWLDAPVMRCASLDTPVPMNKALEDQFLAKNRLEEMIQTLLRF
ncbi:MAG: dehydrogenase [Mucilaginibacter polytrichastri]|nr:dehydrogenase [Mucilaginibacter polytrichastri]